MDRLIKLVVFLTLLLAGGSVSAQTSCGTLSGCPFASTPFSGSELFYVLQGGISKKVTTTVLDSQLAIPLNIGVSQITNGTSGCFVYDNLGIAECTAISNVAVSSLSFGTTGLTPSTSTVGPIVVGGTLATANGGTGITSFTVSGNTTVFTTRDGSVTNGHCVQWDSSFGLVDSGGTCDVLGPYTQNVIADGADPTGVTDSTSAFNAAFNAAISGGQVIIPCGTYKLTPGMNYTIAAGATLTITGGGSGCTNLIASSPTSTFMELQFTSLSSAMHMKGISFLTGNTSTGSIGLLISAIFNNANPAISAQSTVDDVTFRGSDGFSVTNYWGVDLENIGISNISYLNSVFAGPSNNANGTGVFLTGKSSGCSGPCYIDDNNFITDLFTSGSTGLGLGSYAQGVNISTSNFQDVPSGIYSATASVGYSQLTVVGNQFGNAGINLLATSQMPWFMASGNVFISNSSYASITACVTGVFQSYSIANNAFYGVQGDEHGLIVLSGSTYGTVTGNTFNHLAYGVQFASGSSHANLQSNAYSSSVTTPYLDGGTSDTIGGGSP